MKIKKSILKVLAYFGVFNYPVSESEIELFLDEASGRKELQDTLNLLVCSQSIFKMGEFYSLQNDPTLAERRIQGNIKAQSLLPLANRIGKFLFKFPYVRGIGISGSLSKNFADENADLDFFIITKFNRLWIARTIMHLFKKLTFLKNRQHWYCMNYYVDEEALLIEEKNIFTATELFTLLPVSGGAVFNRFFKSNEWACDFFCGYENKMTKSIETVKKHWIKNVMEWVFQNRLGDLLDDYFMRLTSKRWKQKELNHQLNMKGNRMGLCTGKHFSKPNPVFFQNKILTLYFNKLNEAEKIWNQVGTLQDQLIFLREII